MSKLRLVKRGGSLWNDKMRRWLLNSMPVALGCVELANTAGRTKSVTIGSIYTADTTATM